MKPTFAAWCFAILSLLLVITIISQGILHENVNLWMRRITPSGYAKSALGHVNQTTKSKLGIHVNESQINEELEARLAAAASNKKIIIFWAPAFGNKFLFPSPDRKQCGDCDITYNRSLIDDSRTGAVVYHFDAVKSWDMPPKRNPDHLHVFFAMEASSTLKNTYHLAFDTEDKYGMNATMTHRRDSDFFANYIMESMDLLMGHNESIYHKIMKDKSKLAVSVVSDCSTTKGAVVRVALIQQLKEAGLRIDTYGKCFSNWIDGDVLKDSIHRYKFYFSYENSYHCKDYITEKFFSYALTHNTVPVVWGATKEDYEAAAPPGSFIHSEDFDTPKDLIRYLEFLDKDDTEYLKYFRWRTMKPETFPLRDRKTGFCALCRALHGINVDDRFNPNYQQSTLPLFTDTIAKRVVMSLRQYMYGDENPECFGF